MSGELLMRIEEAGVCYRQRTGVMRYERFWGLNNVSLELRQGETLGVIGSNGAGKSTLLRLLAGVLEADRGRVWRRPGVNASLLALNAGFKPELSGRDNAIFGGLLLGMSYQEIQEALEEIKTYSDLEDFFERPVATYSTGMRARLGFSVAIHADPDVLLIDEVLGVGDESFRLKSQAAMQRKIRSNKTVVLVSHSMEAIRELCDRVVWMHKGTSVLSGPADEVIDTYFEGIRLAVKEIKRKEREDDALKKSIASSNTPPDLA